MSKDDSQGVLVSEGDQAKKAQSNPYKTFHISVSLKEMTKFQLNKKITGRTHQIMGALLSKMTRYNKVHLSLQEISEITGIDRCNVHRGLRILESEGYIKKFSTPANKMEVMITPNLLWRYSWSDFFKGLAMFNGKRKIPKIEKLVVEVEPVIQEEPDHNDCDDDRNYDELLSGWDAEAAERDYYDQQTQEQNDESAIWR